MDVLDIVLKAIIDAKLEQSAMIWIWIYTQERVDWYPGQSLQHNTPYPQFPNAAAIALIE
jgi:hypothetical protein